MPGRGRPFPKGVSGNPAGGPRGPRSVKGAKALFGPDAQRTHDELVDLAQNAEDERVRLAACLAILDRIYGKPRNAEIEDDDRPPSNVESMSDEELERRMLESMDDETSRDDCARGS